MKRLFFSLLLIGSVARAESITVTKVDLDKKANNLVIVDLGTSYSLHYMIDPKACVCWVHVGLAGNPVSNIDCKKLAVYPELAPHVNACK